jgi:hypothetical protein
MLQAQNAKPPDGLPPQLHTALFAPLHVQEVPSLQSDTPQVCSSATTASGARIKKANRMRAAFIGVVLPLRTPAAADSASGTTMRGVGAIRDVTRDVAAALGCAALSGDQGVVADQEA